MVVYYVGVCGLELPLVFGFNFYLQVGYSLPVCIWVCVCLGLLDLFAFVFASL